MLRSEWFLAPLKDSNLLPKSSLNLKYVILLLLHARAITVLSVNFHGWLNNFKSMRSWWTMVLQQQWYIVMTVDMCYHYFWVMSQVKRLPTTTDSKCKPTASPYHNIELHLMSPTYYTRIMKSVCICILFAVTIIEHLHILQQSSFTAFKYSWWTIGYM